MPELSVESRPIRAATSLLEHIRPSLYRVNAYRLTGLSIQAGSEQVVAAMRALATAEAQASPVRALAPGELEAAADRQLDTHTLLLDDFFWFWPRPTTRDGRDKALDALARGAWLDAVDVWRVQSQQRGNDGLALHNTAVLFHMMALDLESTGALGPLDARQTKERDVWWKEAFRAWQALHNHGPFWQLYSERLAERFPDRSHLSLVESVRTNLLPAIASINGQLAAERCAGQEAWDRQIALIAATGYPSADILQARRIAVEPFGRVIRTAVSDAVGRTETDTRQGLVEAARLIHQGQGWLPFFTEASLPLELCSLSDEIAVAAVGCLDACGRATGHWAELLTVGEAALGMACGPDTRARLNKHVVIFRTNYSTQVHRQREEQLTALRNRCSNILSSEATGRERIRQLIQCARGDLRELVAAGAGDVDLDAQANGAVARAFRNLAFSLRQDGEPVLLILDALAVAESLYHDADVRKQVTAERDSIEGGLRKSQSAELLGAEGRYPLLAEHASPELYAGNAFRLTGLSVVATERELSRHVQKLEMAERLGTATVAVAGPLSISSPDLEATKAAVQRIHQVEQRLLDEFFWLWPLPEYAVDRLTSSSPLPLNQEQLNDAIDDWKLAASQKLDHGLCAHNLAVMHHLQALDLEIQQRTTALTASECKARDESWIKAFARWREALETPTLWEEVAQRIASLADPRLGRAAMVRLRSGLPAAVLSTAVRLAMRAHDRDPADLKRLTELLTSSGFEPEAVRMAAKPLIDRIREKLSKQAVDAAKKATLAPADAHVVSQGLMASAWAGLEILTHLLGGDDRDSVATHSHDEVALAAADCVLVFARETKDWPAVLKTLKEIESLARGPSARETILSYLKTVSGNAFVDVGTAELDGLSKKLELIVGAAAPAEDRFAQLRALMDANPPLADVPGYLAARGDLFANSLQQLARRANNDDEKYALALEIVRLALTLCKDAELRQKLVDALKSIGCNADAVAVAGRCKGIIGSTASNGEKLTQLGQCAQNQLQLLKRQHGGDSEFFDLVSDTVAGAVRSVAIDVCNTDRNVKTALEWLRFGASIARGPELRQRLEQDITTCEGLVQRPAAIPPPPPQDGSQPRGYWTSCTNCHGGILAFSHRDASGRVFCSRLCLEWVNGPGSFCAKCVAETTDESSGGLSQINGMGQTFMGSSDKCPSCGSVVRRKVVTGLWLPVFPRSLYRVLHSSPSTFYSRRMK